MNRGQTIVVAGATGVVGTQLVKELSIDESAEIRLLSRSPKQAMLKAPATAKAFGYDEIDQAVAGADVVFHLAARNNDQPGSASDFERDNCELTERIASAAKRANVRLFVFATTTKALAPTMQDPYGYSKAVAETRLAALADESFGVHFVRLAPVYGPGSRGKVKLLLRVPPSFRRPIAAALRSAIAIVSVERAAEGLLSVAADDEPLEELCLSDPLGKVSLYRLFVGLVNAGFVLAVPTVLLVPTVVSAAAVATTSKGGVFFKQGRVGTNQQVFECLKFRTMRTGTPIRGTHEVSGSYVTKVGAMLRRFKLDELPQVVNILRREVNVVGPRPCLPNQTELVAERERYGVFRVRPGITGFAQVAGVDMSEPRRLAIYDHRYAAFRSIVWDLLIAMRTVRGGGFGDPIGGTNASSAS